MGGNLLAANIVFAASPTPGTVIQNQATGSYVDTSDNTTKNVESDIVSVTMAEVAGITITYASTPTATTGNIANFDFTITNLGNDPTKFFLPKLPSNVIGGTAGTLQVVGYIPAGGAQVTLASAIDITTAVDTATLTDPTLGGNTTLGSIPAGAAIVVRVPVTVSAAGGSPVSVTLGNTTGQPTTSNTPYVAQTNDLYTFDNPDTPIISGEATGMPINGDATLHQQEASATQSVTAIATDYGDASDIGAGSATGNYRTTAIDGGPNHIVVSGLKLGTNIDGDSGTLQDITATADDTNGTPDDEDAFTTLPSVSTSGTYSLSNIPMTNSVGNATLHAWVDFNKDGSFEVSEYTSTPVNNGATSANLSWTVPSGTTAGSSYARFRLTTQPLTDNTGTAGEDERSIGTASDGEVEDYAVAIVAPVATRDYGDAPVTYDSGTPASHLVPSAPTVYLGTLSPDKELAPNTPLDGSGDNSNGTNDEDGVTFVGGTTLNTGATASVSVVTRGTGVLYAWIDFNGNGAFESFERITNWAGGNSSTGGTTTLTFGVPEGFTGTTYARFRYSSDVAAANPTGSASNGEVEDYQITLAPRLTPATYGNGTPVRQGVCSIYSSTGADQVVTAPAGAKGLTVKLWGAGGGHEFVGTGYAGAGGYTDAQFGSSVVTPGAQFTLVVGRGGVSGGRPDEFSPSAVYGFGAVAGHEQGGGLAGLFTGGTAVLETDQARALAIAGGGGGYENSGSGTGTTGGNGNSTSSGGQSTMRGSTDNLTRTSNSSVIMTAHISSGGGGYQGGGRLPAPNPYSAVTGGSLANIAAASGGSGFVTGTATFGRILSTTDGIGTPPNTTDSDYLTGIGTAGTLSANAGGNARAVLCWDVSDYGDAPATYDVGTPASHLLSSSPSVYLGAIAPDGESDAQPSVAADGDNTNGTSDEDAFTTLPNVPTAGSYSLNSIPVKNTSGAATTLNAWIDFNKDGVFQASEYTSVSISANATTANLNWASIPAGTTAGSTYARFRVTTDALSDNAVTSTVDERSTGTASDGEVEDYPVAIVPPSQPSICSVAGGTRGTNLFANNGTFGIGSSTPGTSTTLPPGRTNYTFQAYGPTSPGDGNYAIVNQLNQNTYTGIWHNTFGHTTGTVDDQMMVVNAAATPGMFYTEILTVPANQNIEFSAWILNLVKASSASIVPIQPNISFIINRIGVDDNNNGTTDEPGEGQVITTSGSVPNTNTPTWVNYGAIVNTGNATQIEYRLVNNAPGGGGNDLLLDDLFAAPCSPMPQGNITGILYRDTNTNNLYNSGTDTTMPANIAVNLKSSTGAIVATAYTDASGNYNFTNVPAGSNYTIEVALTDTDIPSGATATANPSGASTTGIQTGITVTSGATLANQNFGFSGLHANVLLVKRITAVNGDRTQNPNDSTPLNVFVDDSLTNDNNANWPNPKTSGISNFLQGVINAGKVKPGDTIEYTIYFLNADNGDTNNVKICDRIAGAQSLLVDAYGTPGSGKDIQLHKGDGAFTTWASVSTSDLTSFNDVDRALLMTTASAPISCHLNMATGGATDTGTLVIDITGAVNSNQPAWSPLSGSTGAGIANSYGFIRFTTKVNP
jgi:hypothetical protein